MANRYLIDTNIIADFLRGHKESQRYIASLSELNISIVTAAELIQGSKDLYDRSNSAKVLEDFNVIQIKEEISETAYKLIMKYNLKEGILYGDALIAATGIETGSILATNDNCHFKNIEEIKIVNPY